MNENYVTETKREPAALALSIIEKQNEYFVWELESPKRGSLIEGGEAKRQTQDSKLCSISRSINVDTSISIM